MDKEKMTTLSKTLNVVKREAGEIRDWLKPFSATVGALILIALIIVATAITLAFPLLHHPQGWAGYLAQLLHSFCIPGSPCEFQQIYPSFSLMILVFATVSTLLAIIVHRYSHRYDPDLDEMDTYIKAIDDRLDKISQMIEDPDEPIAIRVSEQVIQDTDI
jgi:membrane protein implicated in regulation of membrane protease activity